MVHRVGAVIWDYDNTLVDSRAKNWRVTRRIIAGATGRDPDAFPALSSQDAYDAAMHRTQDWRAFYQVEFKLGLDAIEDAGRQWTRFHLEDDTPTPGFPGVREAVLSLGDRPQGIVSLNTSANIRRWIDRAGLGEAFSVVIGCEEVEPGCQKPAPDGLLECMDRLLDGVPSHAMYVGDHPIDVQCAAAANRALQGRADSRRVVSVGAGYGTVAASGWPIDPEYRAAVPGDVVDLVRRLDGSAKGSGSAD